MPFSPRDDAAFDARRRMQGGAVYINDGNLTFSDCTLTQNTAVSRIVPSAARRSLRATTLPLTLTHLRPVHRRAYLSLLCGRACQSGRESKRDLCRAPFSPCHDAASDTHAPAPCPSPCVSVAVMWARVSIRA